MPDRFNLGVEVAQVLICLAVFPLLLRVRRDLERRAKHGGLGWPTFVRAGSVLIVLVALVWLGETLMG